MSMPFMISGDGNMTDLDGPTVLATIGFTVVTGTLIANGLEKVLSSVAAKQSIVQAYLAQASELSPEIYNQAQEAAERIVGSGDMGTASGSLVVAGLFALTMYYMNRKT